MNLRNALFGLALCLGASLLWAQETKADGAFVVKPYLQMGRHPSPDSLQLLWHSAKTNPDWTVELRTGAGQAWKKVPAAKSTRVAVAGVALRQIYHAPLTGLVPGASFDYRIFEHGKIVFAAKASAPKSAAQPYRFVAFGDIGAGKPAQRALAVRAYAAHPDLVVVPGDIVYERGLVSEYDANFWPVYNADKADDAGVPMMRAIPFVAAPGNHDTDTQDLDKFPDAKAYFMNWEQPLNGPLGAEGGPFVPAFTASTANRGAFIEAAGDSYPRMANFSFDYGNAHWTVVDSNPYVDWTNQELIDWVANDLAAAKDATWHFVVFHHPGFTSSREHFEQQHMRLLSPVLEAGKVDVVFSGHVHNYQRSLPMTFVPDKKGTLLVGGRDNKTVRGRVVPGRWTLDKSFDGQTNTTPHGIIYLVTGAGGQDLYNVDQNNDPDSWQKFTDKFVSNTHSMTIADVDGKTLTIRQISEDGKEVDRFRITK